MAVELDWLDDSHTIHIYRMIGAWTWDEFYPVYARGVEQEREAGIRIDTVVDFRESTRIPPNALSHLKRFSDKLVPNDGLNVFVTSNRSFIVLYNAAARLYTRIGTFFRVVATLEDALTLIEADRAHASQSPIVTPE
jgi:hypothetical protein